MKSLEEFFSWIDDHVKATGMKPSDDQIYDYLSTDKGTLEKVEAALDFSVEEMAVASEESAWAHDIDGKRTHMLNADETMDRFIYGAHWARNKMKGLL